MQTKAFLISAILAFLFILSCGESVTNNKDENNSKDSGIVDQTQDPNKNDVKESEKTESENVVKEEIDSKTLSLPGEKVVFGFETDKGKKMSLSLGKDSKYLVYRFGQNGKVELQYPEILDNTFEKFTYNYYMRGGGPGNAGMDLNYVIFTGDTHKIIIYEEYSSGEPDAAKETTSVGLRIVNLKTNKESKIIGLEKTKIGSLIDFRDNGLIKVEEGGI